MTIEDDLLIQKRFDRLERLEEANETIGETSEIYIANGAFPKRGVFNNMICLKIDQGGGGILYRYDQKTDKWLKIG